MFGIGLVEFLVLVVIALIVFGPERLPEAAKKAATTIRQLRRMADNARNDLADELGPEFRDMDLSDLRNPRRAVQKYVLDGIDEDDVRVDRDLDIRKDLDLRKDLDDLDAEDGESTRSASRRRRGGEERPSRNGGRSLNGGRTTDSDTSEASDDSAVDTASDKAAADRATSDRAAADATASSNGSRPSGRTGTGDSENDPAEDSEDAAEERTTLTLTDDRPPFDPDAT